MEPNPAAIGGALEMLAPVGNLLLVAIDPLVTKNNVVGRTFKMPGELEQATAWAVQRNEQRWNVYWTPNESRPLNNKSGKSDMVRARYFWADCDPDVFRFKGYDAARRHLLDEVLPTLAASASFVVDSGHGLQAFWLIDNPVDVGGEHGAEAFEDTNKRLGAMFGSEGTHNVDRVMRLPGTVNFVGASKISKGYPNAPAMSRLLNATGAVWSAAQVEGWLGRQALHARLAETLRAHRTIAARWEGSTQGLHDGSGSGRDQSMVTMLALAGWEPADIRCVLEQWPHGSAGGREQGDRYWQRMFANAQRTLKERDTSGVTINLSALRETPGAPAVPAAPAAPILVELDEMSPLQPAPSLIRGILPADSVGMVWAPPDSFKSFLTLDWALSVASGLDWLGHKVKPGRVWYLAGEGQGGLRVRVQAWRKARKYFGKINFLHSQRAILLDSEQGMSPGMSALLALVKAGEAPDMIVVDTLARSMMGDESATRDASRYVAALDELVAAIRLSGKRPCVILVHHARKDGEVYRGSSVLRGAADFEFEISRRDDFAITLECHKLKDGGRPPKIELRVEIEQLGQAIDDFDEVVQMSSLVLWMDRPDRKSDTPAEDRANSLLPALRVVLQRHPAGLSQRALTTALRAIGEQVRTDSFGAYLDLLVASGSLVSETGPHRAKVIRLGRVA